MADLPLGEMNASEAAQQVMGRIGESVSSTVRMDVDGLANNLFFHGSLTFFFLSLLLLLDCRWKSA